MTPDGFVALIGIIIAVWTIMPDYRRLHVKFLYSWSDTLVIGFSVIFILFIYFRRMFQYFSLSDTDANLYVLAIVIIASIFEFFHFKYSKLNPEKRQKDYDLFINEMLQTSRYCELSKFLKSTAMQMMVIFHFGQRDIKEFGGSFIRRLYENKGYMEYLSKSYPELGFDISSQEGWDAINFQHKFVRILLETEDSELYHEIAKYGDNGIDEKFPLLMSLFGNMKFAEERELYKPVGEAMIAELTRLSHFPELDRYNWEKTRDFDEREIHRSMLFVGERYFNIMVTEAIEQKIEWHMWLYYYKHLMRAICKNYNLGKDNDPETEFPNRYSYLIYRMFSSMCGWVRAVEKIPANQANAIIKSINLDNENGNIPKSSLLAIWRCLDIFLSEQKIPNKFKKYMLELIFDLYFDLGNRISQIREDAKGYADVTFQLIAALYQKTSNREILFKAWDMYDKFPHRYPDKERSYFDNLNRLLTDNQQP